MLTLMRRKAWVHPAFSPSRTFLLLTLSVTLPHKPVPNTRLLYIHCFALALRHKARNRGDAETKKEDPFHTFIRTYSHRHTCSNPQILLCSPTRDLCHTRLCSMIHSFDVFLQRAYLTAAVFLSYMHYR